MFGFWNSLGNSNEKLIYRIYLKNSGHTSASTTCCLESKATG